MANSNGWGDGAANNAIGWGQGSNNAIGWGSSHATSWAGATDIVGLATDSDAQAFITAAAITDATQQSAIDTLVKGLKTDGIWMKMKAIYPFVGGTASTHKWNLKDPRDLDAAFRLVFNGGWTHSSTGATPNGTNGYADTKLAPNVMAQNSISISSYIRTTLTTPQIYMGSSGGGVLTYLYNTDYQALNSLDNPTFSSIAGQNGLISISRIASNQYKLFKNGTVLNTISSVSLAPNSNALYISARNNGGGISQYGNNQTAFAHISDGLTDTEASNLYSRVQTYQNSLNRAV